MSDNKTQLVLIVVLLISTVVLLFLYIGDNDNSELIKSHERHIEKLKHEMDSITQLNAERQKSQDSLNIVVSEKESQVQLLKYNIKIMKENNEKVIINIRKLNGIDSYHKFTELLDRE